MLFEPALEYRFGNKKRRMPALKAKEDDYSSIRVVPPTMPWSLFGIKAFFIDFKEDF